MTASRLDWLLTNVHVASCRNYHDKLLQFVNALRATAQARPQRRYESCRVCQADAIWSFGMLGCCGQLPRSALSALTSWVDDGVVKATANQVLLCLALPLPRHDRRQNMQHAQSACKVSFCHCHRPTASAADIDDTRKAPCSWHKVTGDLPSCTPVSSRPASGLQAYGMGHAGRQATDDAACVNQQCDARPGGDHATALLQGVRQRAATFRDNQYQPMWCWVMSGLICWPMKRPAPLWYETHHIII